MRPWTWYRNSLIAVAAALTALTSPSPVLAAWPHYPGQVVLAQPTANVLTPVSAADSSGGMIVAWVDTRSDAGDIYVQRADYAGNVRWTSNGLPAGVSTGLQTKVVIIPDGAGGVFLAWEDHRNDPNNADIYCQHIASSGTISPGWPAAGLQLTIGAGNQLQPAICSDGSTGAYVAWEETRYASVDVLAKHLVSAGIDLTWPSLGVVVCVHSGTQNAVSMAPDGLGNAYVAWQDTRDISFYGTDIYMQRVLSSGAVNWTANGVPLTTFGEQVTPALAASPGQGVTVLWIDNGSGNGWDIRSDFVSTSGAVSLLAGYGVATGLGDQVAPAITTSNDGAVVAAWQDNSTGSVFTDIYTVSMCGGAPCGSAVRFTTLNYQRSPILVSDGYGGGIAAWTDTRFGNNNIRAQRLTSGGQAPWATNGISLSWFNSSGSNELSPTAVADSRGGALVAFIQPISIGHALLVAQRVDHFGYLGNPEPVITSARDITSDQGGLVHLVWRASYLDIEPDFTVGSYNVWRRIDAAAAVALSRRARVVGEGEAVGAGPAIRTTTAGTVTQTWEFLGSVPARAYTAYSFPAPTLGDSTSGSTPYTVFMVDAQARSGVAFWSSPADSGYSIDNLAPATPAAFTGNYGGNTTRLHWSRNTETDLYGYRIYRGPDASFVPSPANRVASPPDTGYADSSPAGGHYKLSAVDVYGNESSFALLTPQQTTGVAPPRPLVFALEPVRPNPTSGPRMIVTFVLPSSIAARLELLDVGGRRMAEREVGSLGPGRHEVDLTEGQRLAPGVYEVRLMQGRNVKMTRVAVLH